MFQEELFKHFPLSCATSERLGTKPMGAKKNPKDV